MVLAKSIINLKKSIKFEKEWKENSILITYFTATQCYFIEWQNLFFKVLEIWFSNRSSQLFVLHLILIKLFLSKLTITFPPISSKKWLTIRFSNTFANFIQTNLDRINGVGVFRNAPSKVAFDQMNPIFFTPFTKFRHHLKTGCNILYSETFHSFHTLKSYQ